jgi:hypothetical protein
MNRVELMTAIEAIAAERWYGRASAAKRGRNPAYPYVPVINYDRPDRISRFHTWNPVKGVAFATREEAVAYAQKHIDAERNLLRKQLAEPRYRALRKSVGLPMEIE